MIRVKSRSYRDWLRQLPCAVCKDDTSTEVAHTRFSDARVGKPESGMGIKSHDYYTMPLCSKHHQEQHIMNEWRWWYANGIDPVLVGPTLFCVWSNGGDYNDAIRVLFGDYGSVRALVGR